MPYGVCTTSTNCLSIIKITCIAVIIIKDPDFFFFSRVTNQMSLEAAVEATAKFLNKAKKPVMIGGPMMRIEKAASDSFMEMADASGYAIAILPSAKGSVTMIIHYIFCI
jgi:TPP-dependent 2-oxoacid decarboxylase